MHPSIQTIFKIYTLRAKPQDIDTSNGLLKVLLVPTYILLGVFYNIFLISDTSFFKLYLLAAAMLMFDMLLTYAVLQSQHKAERWLQTFCAMLGVQIITIVFFIVLSLLMPGMTASPPDANAMVIALLIQLWGFAVMCMILKEALDCPLFISILVNIALIIFSQFVFSSLQSLIL